MGKKLLLKLSAFHSDCQVEAQPNQMKKREIIINDKVNIPTTDRINRPKVNLVDNRQVKIKEDQIQKQPSFRTVQGRVRGDMREMLDTSLIGLTETAEWADMLQERIRIMGLYHVSVKGISHQKFLVTFNDEVDKIQQGTLWVKILSK